MIKETTKGAIREYFEKSQRRVYRHSDLTKILSENRANWEGAAYWTQREFVNFLVENTSLRKITLQSEQYADENRYIWSSASEYEVALSLRANSYLTHATAIFLHGLSETHPQTIYVNHEQSVKPRGGGILTQSGIDRAFKSVQRQSNYIFDYDDKKILVLNGKNTGRFGVTNFNGSRQETLPITNVERTLIDSSVRPVYAGGVARVTDAFKRAREKVSVDQLIMTLKQLDYVYPYHQVIGFYMERADYSELSLTKLERLGISFDFYATYGSTENDYDKRWRLFFPRIGDRERA